MCDCVDVMLIMCDCVCFKGCSSVCIYLCVRLFVCVCGVVNLFGGLFAVYVLCVCVRVFARSTVWLMVFVCLRVLV